MRYEATVSSGGLHGDGPPATESRREASAVSGQPCRSSSIPAEKSVDSRGSRGTPRMARLLDPLCRSSTSIAEGGGAPRLRPGGRPREARPRPAGGASGSREGASRELAPSPCLGEWLRNPGWVNGDASGGRSNSPIPGAPISVTGLDGAGVPLGLLARFAAGRASTSRTDIERRLAEPSFAAVAVESLATLEIRDQLDHDRRAE